MQNINEIISNFDIFKCEYSFDFKLVNKTPLSIGSGKKPFGKTDNPIVRIRRFHDGVREEPYIPGSSLKGILRSEVERFARTIYGDSPETVCNIFLDATEEYSEKKREKGDNSSNYKPCLICSIFGGQTIASRIKVGNAFLTRYEDKMIDIIRKVSINRLTGAQHARRLYDVEYLAPEQEFKWLLTIENIDLLGDAKEEYDKRILTIIFYLLGKIIYDGIEVGGRRSIGYGRLKVKEWSTIKYELKDMKIKGNDVTEAIKNKLKMVRDEL